MKLKPYWFSTNTRVVWLVPDIGNLEDRYLIEPMKFRRQFPGACLFSRQEAHHGLVKCWLYTFKNAECLLDSNDRGDFVYWVDPSLLVEIAML